MNWCKPACVVEEGGGGKEEDRKTGGKGPGEAVTHLQAKESG